MKLDEKAYKRFWSKVDRSDYENCWNWTASTDLSGYPQLTLGKKSYKGHRLAFQQFFDDDIEHKFVRHSCKNNKCVNPSHLVLKANNPKHLLKYKPPVKKGIHHGKAKLVEKDIKNIRNLYATGNFTYRQLGAYFGVTHESIRNVVHSKTWSHI